MPVRSAREKLQDLRTFIPNAKKAIGQFEQLAKRLEEPAHPVIGAGLARSRGTFH